MSVILIIIIILITYTIFNFNINYESFTNNNKIGIIIPTTSNNRNYVEVKKIDFFEIFMNNFLKTFNQNYHFTIYLGFDDDDQFYNSNLVEIKNYFDLITNDYNINLKLHKISNLKGKVGEIWSKLADIAVNDNCEYLYQIGDDVKIINSGWEEAFINKLKKLDNVGVVGPLDVNNSTILTQSFVHNTHLNIFDNYFPKELINWFVDDWITNVYKPNNSFCLKKYKIKNEVNARYNVVNDKKKYKKILKRDKKLFDKYSSENFDDLVYNKLINTGRERIQNYINLKK